MTRFNIVWTQIIDVLALAVWTPDRENAQLTPKATGKRALIPFTISVSLDHSALKRHTGLIGEQTRRNGYICS